MIGGVPSASWTQCGSMIPAGSSAATINAAMAAAVGTCGPDHYILLAAGNFTTLNATLQMKSFIALRGAGANSTFLAWTSLTSSCGAWGGFGVPVCFSDASGLYYGSAAVAPGGTNSANWTGPYTEGSTSLTFANIGSSGIVNGQWIYLDQNNDTSITSTGLMVCDTTSPACSLEGGSPGRCSVGPGGSGCVSGGHVDRNQVQIVQVTGGCSSACTGAGPFTITINTGIRGINWRSSQSPGAWWSTAGTGIMQFSGLENVSLDYTNDGGADFGVVFTNTVNSWLSGVRSINSVRNHVWYQQAAHNTTQNSYFFGTQNSSEESYGTEAFISSDNLTINNIYQQITTPSMVGNTDGNVYAYLFAVNDLTHLSTSFYFECQYNNHDAAVLYPLFEGNVCGGTEGDVFHGTGGLGTHLRDVYLGWESGKTTNTVGFQQFSYNRFDNSVGNVLGCDNTSTTVYPGNCGAPYTTIYQTSPPAGAGAAQAAYDLGSGNTESPIVVAADPYVAASLLRWGNTTTVAPNAGVPTFTNSEVPSTLTDGYSNPVPATHTISSSYLYPMGKPAWWPNGKPFPASGPDVTGGNIPGTGGHGNTNPAADCYLNTMHGPIDGTGSVLSFNAATCYPTPSGTSVVSVASTNPASAVTITVTPPDNNGLSNGSTPFTRTYTNGTSVTLTAPLTAGGNNFASWTGCASTSGASGQICSITPNTNVTVTANYSTPPATATLTFNSTSPSSGVLIAASPNDNGGHSSVTTPGTLVYNVGTVATFTAPTTAGGNPFASWSGCPSSSANVCSFTVSANLTITANYTPPPVTETLTLMSTNPASGVAIANSPADNNSHVSTTTPGTLTFNTGTTVTLTAPANSGANPFASWTNCPSPAANVCTVTVTANSTITANYTQTFTLTLASTNPASGVVIAASPTDTGGHSSATTPGTLTYASGAAVTLTAPLTVGGNTFSSWTNCPSPAANVCSITVSANRSITANYITTFTLTIESTNPNSGTAITVSPNDNNGQGNGSTTFTRVYTSGATVTLVAPATSGGNAFVNWTGCTSPSTETCTQTVSANATLTANYTATPPTVNLNVASTNPSSGTTITASPTDNNGHSSVVTPGTLNYNTSTSVTLTAPATAGGNAFVAWLGCDTAVTETCTIAPATNATVTATYASPPVTFDLTLASTNPASGVVIAVSPSDNGGHSSATTPQTLNYDSGTTVTVTAPATAGTNAFVNFTNCPSAAANVCTVTVSADSTITANYATTFNLSLLSTSPASGVVIGASPADNNAQSSATTPGTLNYDSGVTVTLTAPTTAGGNPFANFTNCPSPAANVCTITVAANSSITANYTPPTPTVNLTVASTNPASGVAIPVSPSDNGGHSSATTAQVLVYNQSTQVTLTAPATASGNNFINWTGCDLASGVTCNIAPATNRTVTANYATPPATATLTIRSSPNIGAAITVSPLDNNGHGNGTTAFTRVYNVGTVVTLVAPATFSGAAFLNWSGCTSPSTETCTQTVSANATITANYAPPPVTETLTIRSVNPATAVTITVSPNDVNGQGIGNTQFARIYNVGTAVTLTAPSTAGGNTFSAWSGCTTTTTVTCHITLNANSTVTATYVTPVSTFTLSVNSAGASTVPVNIQPVDTNGMGAGNTNLARVYNSGTNVLVTAPATSGGAVFRSWSGCTTTSGLNCSVTVASNRTVTANYSPAPPTPTGFTVNGFIGALMLLLQSGARRINP